jgi:hypothetical protein
MSRCRRKISSGRRDNAVLSIIARSDQESNRTGICSTRLAPNDKHPGMGNRGSQSGAERAQATARVRRPLPRSSIYGPSRATLHMAHDAMAALYGRGVVEHVPQHDSISGPEVGLQLRVRARYEGPREFDLTGLPCMSIRSRDIHLVGGCSQNAVECLPR